MIHESAHQPLVGKAPGLTLGPYRPVVQPQRDLGGTGGPWVNYLARSSYLLQQGHFAADLVYFYGEDSNLTALFRPQGAARAGRLRIRLHQRRWAHPRALCRNGRITTTSGMSYRVLGLDPYSAHMSLPVLRAIHKLVEDGRVVAGAKPIDDPASPTIKGNSAADR